MEGITHGIRPEDANKPFEGDSEDVDSDKQVKYRIKTKYGDIPIYEKKDPKKSKDLF